MANRLASRIFGTTVNIPRRSIHYAMTEERFEGLVYHQGVSIR
jgi:hypothetical protein